MKVGKSLQRFLTESRETDSYWVERLKLSFSLGLEKQRETRKLSYADIAKRIESSAPYVTKVFRGDSNLTIESMVKLARSIGADVEISVVDKASRASEWGQTYSAKKPVPAVNQTGTTVVNFDRPFAANNADWRAQLAELDKAA